MFPSEHAARIANPESFDKETFRRMNVAPGIDIIMGKKPGSETMETQAYRFNKEQFSEEQAKTWLKEHDITPISFEPAGDDGALSATETEQSILIFPRRKVFIQKYNEWCEFGDLFFDTVIENFHNPALFKPFIDEQHDQGVSFGDINDIYKASDGLRCKVRLNSLGIQAIKDRQYKYVSPWIENLKDSNGSMHKNVLCSVSLTNIPALLGTVPQLQEQMALEYGKENTMFEEFKKYLKEKSIPAGIKLTLTGAQLEAVSDEEFMGKLKEFMDGLYTALTNVADLAAQIETLTGEKKVALEQAEAAKLEVANMRSNALKREADTLLLDAVNNGYPAALCDMKKEEFMKDPERVRKELSLWPKTKQGQSSIGAKKDSVKVSDEDRSIMLSFGNDDKGKLYFDPDKPEDVNRFRELNKNVKDKE